MGLPVSIQEIFRQNGIDPRWIRGQTPIGKTRAAEILAWLAANGNPPYAVIDDELDHLTGIPVERIVHVEDGFSREGFTPAHARKAALVFGLRGRAA